jgi:hypothetical protein
MTTTFDAAFDANLTNTHLVVGENGTPAFNSATSPQDEAQYDSDTELAIIRAVDMFQSTHSHDENTIRERVDKVLTVVNKEILTMVLALVLFMREPRKGKGQKDVTFVTLLHLWSRFPNAIEAVVKHLPNFGCWGDLVKMMRLPQSTTEQRDFMAKLFAMQLLADDCAEKPSLAGKWAPRETGKDKEWAKLIARHISSSSSSSSSSSHMANYRRLIVRLNAKLQTVEVAMCGKNWSTIDPSAVPSKAITTYSKAMFDEKKSSYPIVQRNPGISHANNRRHHKGDEDFEDREACREKFINHVKSGGKINSVVTDLHQIVARYREGDNEDPIWEAQWNARIKEIRELLAEMKTKNEGRSNPLIMPMIDLSGSMDGTPIDVAITLGLFTAQLQDVEDISQLEPAFANRFFTFSTNTAMIHLPRGTSLHEKVRFLERYQSNEYWGGSTNIDKAITTLIDMAVGHSVPSEEMPRTLAIFSDMQFDVGSMGTWGSTMYDLMKKRFADAGYPMIQVLFWNLRATRAEFPVTASTPQTFMVSGFSTRMMDLFFSGTLMANVAEKGEQDEATTATQFNPTTLVRTALKHEMFSDIKWLVSAVEKDFV